MPSAPVRVLIVDDHASVRAGVAALLGLDARIEVVGEAATGRDALDLVQRLRPNVLVLDVQLPDLDGIEVCRRVAEAATARVLILTAFEIEENIAAALDAGAAGFLTKAAGPEEMSAAVHAVAAGEAYLTPSVTRRVIERTRKGAPGPTAGGPGELTAREREIWQLMGTGLTNKQIAETLTISPATAKTHVSRILAKLGVATRTRAALLAQQHSRG